MNSRTQKEYKSVIVGVESHGGEEGRKRRGKGAEEFMNISLERMKT